MNEPQASTLILGIGNSLLCDEGVGIHALDFLQRHLPASCSADYLDGGTLSFTLAPEIESYPQLIVIDAAHFDSPPGEVRAFEGDDMDRFLGRQRRRSVHEVGLMDLLTIARLADALPARRALIGVQPERVDWDERPTAAVNAALPEVCRQTQRLLEAWAV